MKIDGQMDYWVHMLDESFPQRKDLGDHSYYAMWKQEFPEYSDPDRLAKMLARRFNRYMYEKFGDSLERRLKKFTEIWLAYDKPYSYERAETAILASFNPEEITDTSYFWEQIPARVYKAIISRNRAKSQGTISHEVSPKVLKDCLDNICCSAAILDVNSERKIDSELKQTEMYKIIQGFIPEKRKTRTLYELRIDTATAMTMDLYIACSSVVQFKASQRWNKEYSDIENKYKSEEGEDWFFNHDEEMNVWQEKVRNEYGAGQWLCNCTDGDVGNETLDEMKTIPYDIYEHPDKAIPFISRTIDVMHIRGDLAGAFIEGGAPTCQQTSNMKPDELWENSGR